MFHLQSQLNPCELVSLLDHHRRQSSNQLLKTSLQTVIDFVEGATTSTTTNCKPKHQHKEVPHRKSSSPDENLLVKRTPTEDDLETGCFTDVSFAGTFAQAAQPEESSVPLETDGGCFTEVSFAGTFARSSCEPPRPRLEDSRSAVRVSRVTVNPAAPVAPPLSAVSVTRVTVNPAAPLSAVTTAAASKSLPVTSPTGLTACRPSFVLLKSDHQRSADRQFVRPPTVGDHNDVSTVRGMDEDGQMLDDRPRPLSDVWDKEKKYSSGNVLRKATSAYPQTVPQFFNKESVSLYSFVCKKINYSFIYLLKHLQQNLA
jgi:hypothetical protein